MEDKYKELADKYEVSARTYFYVLGLATFKTTGTPYIGNSTEIAKAEKTKKTWKLACEILQCLADHNAVQNPQWEKWTKKENNAKMKLSKSFGSINNIN